MRIASGSSILFASLALSASGAPVNEAHPPSHPNSPRPAVSATVGGKMSGSTSHLGRGLPSGAAIAARDASPLCILPGVVGPLPIVGPTLAGMVNSIAGCGDSASSESVTTDTECTVTNVLSAVPMLGPMLNPILDGLGLCPGRTQAESVDAANIQPLAATELEQIAAAVSKAAASIEAAHGQPTGKSKRQLLPIPVPTPPAGLPVTAPGAPPFPVPPNTPASSSSAMPSSTSLAARQLIPIPSGSSSMSESAAPTQSTMIASRRAEDDDFSTSFSVQVPPSTSSTAASQSGAASEPTLGARQLPPVVPSLPVNLPVPSLPVDLPVPSLPVNLPVPSLPINLPVPSLPVSLPIARALPINPPVNPPVNPVAHASSSASDSIVASSTGAPREAFTPPNTPLGARQMGVLPQPPIPSSSASTPSTASSDASSTGMASRRDLPAPSSLPVKLPINPPNAPVSPPAVPNAPVGMVPSMIPAPVKDTAGKTPASDLPVFHSMAAADFGPEMTTSASSAGATSTSA